MAFGELVQPDLSIYGSLQPPRPQTPEQRQAEEELALQRQERIRDLQQKRIEDFQNQQDQTAIQQAVRQTQNPDGTPNWDAMYASLGTNPRAQIKAGALIDGIKERASKAAAEQLKQKQTEADFMARIMGGIDSQGTLDAAKSLNPGGIAAQLPDSYDDPRMQNIKNVVTAAGTSIQEQIAQHEKADKAWKDGDARLGLASTLANVTDAADYQNQMTSARLFGARIPGLSAMIQRYDALMQSGGPDAVRAQAQQDGLTVEQQEQATERKAAEAQRAKAEADANARIIAQNAATLAQGERRLGIEQQNANTSAARLKMEANKQQADLSDEALNQAADQYYATGKLPATGYGQQAAALKTAVMNRAALRHAGANLAANSAAFGANKATLQQLEKQEAAVGAFESTGLKNLQMFVDTAAKVPDTGAPWLNAPIRSVDRNLLGSQDVAAFDAARRVALTEIARVVNNPNLVGTLSDSARAEVSALNPENATFAQIKRVAGVLRQDMANRRQGLQDQISDISQRLGGAPASTLPQTTSGGGQTKTMYFNGQPVQLTPVAPGQWRSASGAIYDDSGKRIK